MGTIGGCEIGRAAGRYAILIAYVGRRDICRNQSCEILANIEGGAVDDVAQRDIFVCYCSESGISQPTRYSLSVRHLVDDTARRHGWVAYRSVGHGQAFIWLELLGRVS